MASNSLVIFSSLLLLLHAALPSAKAHETAEKKINVVVEGKVYCQACDQFGTWSLTGAEPIASAKVAVICKDDKKRVSYYKAFKTDGNGYFYALLEEFRMVNPLMDHPLQSCRVRLVASPLENCSLLSNINNGLNGAELRYEDKKQYSTNYNAVIYAAGPLAFRPANCPTHS